MTNSEMVFVMIHSTAALAAARASPPSRRTVEVTSGGGCPHPIPVPPPSSLSLCLFNFLSFRLAACSCSCSSPLWKGEGQAARDNSIRSTVRVHVCLSASTVTTATRMMSCRSLLRFCG